MKFIYDDGGRSAAGFKGTPGDCVTRAVAIASGLPYLEVYKVMADGMGTQRDTGKFAKRGRTARRGVSVQRKWFKDYMRSVGFEWVPTMMIGQGCTTHLTDGELPTGRLVVNVSKLCTCVIDGVVRDTWDPQREIAEFRQFLGWQMAPLAKGEQRNQNGIFTIRRRCVYGYWIYKGGEK